MSTGEILTQAREAMTVKRVFGEPIERDGVTIVPAALVIGGAGGGGGGRTTEGHRDQEGSGGGYGFVAWPIGAYVSKGDRVTWEPARDATAIAIGWQVVAITLLLVARSIVRILAGRKQRDA